MEKYGGLCNKPGRESIFVKDWIYCTPTKSKDNCGLNGPNGNCGKKKCKDLKEEKGKIHDVTV